jgi:hypothetical protein
MRGKGVVLAVCLVVVLCLLPAPVEAGRGSQTLRWQNGLRISVQFENNDYWTTNQISEIYFTLTLLDLGTVADFQELVFRITLVTISNHTGEIRVTNPWNEVNDAVRVVARFNVTPEQVNYAGWDTYMAEFYYDFSVFVEMDDGEEMELYTHVYDGTPLTISTFSFIVFWPFPPIVLMCFVYWGLYFGLKKFNARYKGSKEVERYVPAEKPQSW